MKHIIDQVFSLTNTKLACFTLDYELDYGHRIGVSNIIADRKTEINNISDC